MPTNTADIIAAILTFIAGVLSLALTTTGIVPANLVPWVNFAIGILQLALVTFFVAAKPIASYRVARAARAVAAPK